MSKKTWIMVTVLLTLLLVSSELRVKSSETPNSNESNRPNRLNEPNRQNELKAKIEKLVKNLGVANKEKHEAATKSLEEIGEPADSFLEEALQSVNPGIRRRARILLRRIEGKRLGLTHEICQLKTKLKTLKHDFILTDSNLIDQTAYLKQQYNLPIKYELAAREIALEKQTLTLKGLPLKSSLKHILTQYGLIYTFRDNDIWIIKSGTVLKEIQIKTPNPITELDKKVYSCLEQRITFPFERPAPLTDVLDFIRETIKDINIIPRKEVDLKEKFVYDAENILLKDAFSQILSSKNLGYMVKEGAVVITSHQKAVKPLLQRLKDIIAGKIEHQGHYQVKYKIDRWKQGKNDAVLIFNHTGQAHLAIIDKNAQPFDPGEYYRYKLRKKVLIKALKMFIDNNLLDPGINQIKVEDDLPLSSITLKVDEYEYNLFFPLTLNLEIPDKAKALKDLQTIEKHLNELIDLVKEKGRKIEER